MEFFGEVAGWFADPANWSGQDGIPARLGEHLVLSLIPLIAAILIALPIGAWIGHTGRFTNVAINVANVGRAIPSLAILAFVAIVSQPFFVMIGLRSVASEAATIVALVALAIPPILTNTSIGIGEVDDEMVEAGRGMGMRGGQILRQVELPVALPIILVGIRTAAVQVVATATLGAVVATGGLGRYIIDGIAQRRNEEVFAGALIVAFLSILTELAFTAIARATTSRGLAGRDTAMTDTVQAASPRGI
ncbi:MAG: ABC transporter permease [Candidatus Limnocylindria bacterium]